MTKYDRDCVILLMRIVRPRDSIDTSSAWYEYMRKKAEPPCLEEDLHVLMHRHLVYK